MTFYGTLASLPTPGQAIVIAGKTTNDAKHLEIDFLISKSDQNNVILHLCMRLDRQTLVINTKIDGVWCVGHQINLTHLSSGGEFKVQILMMMEEFFISFENGLRCTYPYRTKIEQVGLVRVSADIDCVTLLEQKEAFTNSNANLTLISEVESIFTNNIGRNFIAGDVIVMKGVAMSSSNENGSFSIIFSDKDSEKTIFKLLVRFDEKRVVYAGDVDRCDLDQKSNRFPFVLGKIFKLAVGFSATHIVISIDGERFLKFKFRLQEQLQNLRGFFITTPKTNKLQMRISSVDHFNIGNDECDTIETYSNPDCTCTC